MITWYVRHDAVMHKEMLWFIKISHCMDDCCCKHFYGCFLVPCCNAPFVQLLKSHKNVSLNKSLVHFIFSFQGTRLS